MSIKSFSKQHGAGLTGLALLAKLAGGCELTFTTPSTPSIRITTPEDDFIVCADRLGDVPVDSYNDITGVACVTYPPVETVCYDIRRGTFESDFTGRRDLIEDGSWVMQDDFDVLGICDREIAGGGAVDVFVLPLTAAKPAPKTETTGKMTYSLQ